MYPSYKVQDALDEYAVVLFGLLNEGYRSRYRHYQMMAQLILLPNIEDSARSKFLQELEWATQGPSDILKSDGEGSSPAEIKKALQG